MRLACSIALAGLVAGGCARSYRVDVRNLTDQPVTATLAVREPGVAQPRTVRAYIGPQDRRTVERPVASSGSTALLLVDFQGNVGSPAELVLSPGVTAVNVLRTDEGASGHIRLQQVK